MTLSLSLGCTSSEVCDPAPSNLTSLGLSFLYLRQKDVLGLKWGGDVSPGPATGFVPITITVVKVFP